MEAYVRQQDLINQDYGQYILQGIDYNQYKMNMLGDLLSNPDDTIRAYIKLNQSRMHRVEMTYTLSEGIKNQLKGLRHKMYWLVITAHWCGDAAQNLPVFNAVAEASNGKIEMKLVYRDQYPELMNAYLTNGARSIPKIIQLDRHFNTTGIWGPRPGAAQKLVNDLKSNPETAPGYANQLHLWYAKDKHKSLEVEVGNLLGRANKFFSDSQLN
ncbi:MAG: thioredoxin family protein [Saprospiraceae bacterium]|nr:thioredoxin family protein [Saprospiraceae bacterium]